MSDTPELTPAGLKHTPGWLAHQARERPHAPAVMAEAGPAGADVLTFAQLHEQAAVAAGNLAVHGVGAGDRVAVLARNGIDYVVLVHGLMRLGAVLVPLNVRLKPAELDWQLQDARVKALVYGDDLAGVAGLLTRRPEPALPLAAAVAQPGSDSGGPSGATAFPAVPPLPPPQASLGLDNVHCIIYTSGTTGRPKGVQLTYGNQFWSAVGSMLNLPMRESDRWLACLPLFHIGGLSIILRGVIYGISVVVHRAFDAAAVNQAIDEHQVSHVSLVAAMLERVLSDRGPRSFPASLRCILLGGGPAPPVLLERAARQQAPVLQTYGLTETASQVATLAPDQALARPGSAGRPLPTAEVRIDADGRAAAPGEVGEILVRGPTVTPGYINQPEATRQALRDGWLHTGDLGCLDEEGFLHVVDRRDDLIISGGENVYPAEIEAILAGHPGVAEAGVVGLDDRRWGQVPAAAVVPRTGHRLTKGELTSYCSSRLANYKVPVRFIIVGTLPRTSAGKLLRRHLKPLFEGDGGPRE